MGKVESKKVFDFERLYAFLRRAENASLEEVKELVFDSISLRKKLFIVTVNPEILYHASRNFEYAAIIERANLLLPDGIGVIFASRFLGGYLRKRVTGVDLVESLLKDGRVFSLYLLGSREEVIESLKDRIEKQYPHIRLCGFHHGYFSQEEKEKILGEIGELKPDVLLIGMGFPQQDFLAFEAIKRSLVTVAMGVGGSFDVLSGFKKRAPKVLRRLGLEWLWRVALEPKRIKRISILPHFFLQVIKLRFRKGGTIRN